MHQWCISRIFRDAFLPAWTARTDNRGAYEGSGSESNLGPGDLSLVPDEQGGHARVGVAVVTLPVIRDVVGRVGLADVAAFGLTKEGAMDMLSRLGYRGTARIQAVRA